MTNTETVEIVGTLKVGLAILQDWMAMRLLGPEVDCHGMNLNAPS